MFVVQKNQLGLHPARGLDSLWGEAPGLFGLPIVGGALPPALCGVDAKDEDDCYGRSIDPP